MAHNDLTHFNADGEAHMVDVGHKEITVREAVTEGRIYMEADTLRRIMEGTHKKGDVLGIARVAGIMGAKQCANLVPLCHPLMITNVELDLTPDPENNCVYAKGVVRCNGQTGVEMEALCAVQVALLTIYDMCKAVDRGMVITDVGLLEKQGGKSGHWKKAR
ncbi:MAG: cyclic pyranopterin monophosphate synthase MoaC [Gammaproteobacteria bacterium]|nr:cyclic pyranopterin monophosphate synthase MoaC [Gammaproteobacteria bacterium]